MRIPVLIALALYLLMGGVTFAAYAIDKRAVRRGARRTPEATLHALELAFGWPGALLAQRVLRHKTRKRPYLIVLWLIVALHGAAWAGALWLSLR